MTRHYPDLGSVSDWLKRAGTSFQPIRSTTKVWVVTRHQYGISALVTQTSFCEGSSGDLARRRLFSQARYRYKILKSHFLQKMKEEENGSGIAPPELTPVEAALEKIIEKEKEFEKQYSNEDSGKLKRKGRERPENSRRDAPRIS